MNRNNNFSMIHIIAALMVIWGHCFSLSGTGIKPVVFATDVHNIGVKILFIVSGYLVAKSLLRSKKLGIYYIKRIVRLWPPFFVCVCLTVLICILFTTANHGDYVIGAKDYVINNALFRIKYNLPGVFENNFYPGAVNGSLWTLPVEFILQLLLPLPLLFCFKNKRKLPFLYGVMYIGLVVSNYLLLNIYTDLKLVYNNHNYIWLFKLGAYYFGGAFYAILPNEQLTRLCKTELALFIFIGTVCLGSNYPEFINSIILPYVIVTFGQCSKCVFTDIFNKFDVAYGLYLYSFLVQQILIDVLCIRTKIIINALELFAMASVISFVFALIQKQTIEKWAGKFSAMLCKWYERFFSRV